MKEGSIYDGDTLRVVRGSDEQKIRFCGIDAPEKEMPMGIEARDHLRSLVEIDNGKLLLVPIEQDRWGLSSNCTENHVKAISLVEYTL